MAFSQGFNSTFRSLDNAFQWRAAQDQNQQQFDERLSENKRQFNETAAQQNELNQSTLKLREIQGRELEALINKTEQATAQSAEMHPIKMDLAQSQVGLTDARSGYLGEQTRSQALSNDLADRTMESTVARKNAENRKSTFDANLAIEISKQDTAKAVDMTLRGDDGQRLTPEQLASDPKRLQTFSGIITRTGEFTDTSFDIGEHDFASVVPVDPSNPKGGYHLVRSRGGKRGIEPIVGEGGEPVVVSYDEMVGYVAETMAELDQGASLAGGGSTRDGQIQSMAADEARRTLGAPPTNPGPAPQGVDIAALEEQSEANLASLASIEQELAATEREINARRMRQRGGDGSQSQTVEALQARQEQLLQERAQITRSLEEIGSVSRQATLADRYEKESAAYDTRRRTLTDTYTTRAQRPEVMERVTATNDVVRNRMVSGRSDVSATDLQSQRAEQVTDAMERIGDAAYRRTYHPKTGEPESEKDPVMGQRLQTQAASLMQNPATAREWQAIVSRPGMLETITRNAIDLSGNDPDRVSLQAGLTMAMENVAVQDVGAVLDYAASLAAERGQDMSPEQYQALSQRVAEVVSQRGSNDKIRPGSDEARALASEALIPQRTPRSLGD